MKKRRNGAYILDFRHDLHDSSSFALPSLLETPTHQQADFLAHVQHAKKKKKVVGKAAHGMYLIPASSKEATVSVGNVPVTFIAYVPGT